MIVTLEQARAMRWPFRNPRQPMGLLLDQGTIAAPDLQRASRAAYSPRFKAACLMLLRELVLTPNAPARADHAISSTARSTPGASAADYLPDLREQVAGQRQRLGVCR